MSQHLPPTLMRKMFGRRRMRLTVALGAGVSLGLLSLAPTAASAAELQQGNSTLRVEPDTSLGIWSWEIDGAEYLTQQWYWYRLGNSGPEQPINTLSHTILASTPEQLTVQYEHSDFTLDVQLQLTGGIPGTHQSQLNQVVTITNTSDADLDFHLFKYVEFDLDFAGFTDSLFMDNSTATQIGSNGAFMSMITDVAADRFEAAIRDSLLNSLSDEGPTTLANIDTQLDVDVEFAFQWDLPIGPEESEAISLLQDVVGIPEPGGLMMLAAVSMAELLRRRTGL